MKNLTLTLLLALFTTQTFAMEVFCTNEHGDIVEGTVTRKTDNEITSGEWTLKPSISTFDYSVQGVTGSLTTDASVVETPDFHWSLLVFKIFPGTSNSILFTHTGTMFTARVVLGSTSSIIDANLSCTLNYPPRF